ncbi:pyridoxal kinase PdxY [Propionibacterium freudenreichii]|uniref:pyridoxal kinase PdxY n=1 Tax=Propionibacterium freudenreichii TaxID=1744 RepID=UPI000BC3470E|nr:pyridoxal kinase PdxY [Propionibacterium freudenreichii]MDK9299297.1 pyridoxal kinase PdxY [Propionibacterium freudenreichii]MDK9593119.1 pyridoxal kinase PdxY [Propionibacterium freudenreichii]WFF34101.1 pyridoxal kinase PdxY [Propionibacterium freudenreichii]WFF36332.1 pyridoxal kinase PdxY [Propionibacterium freudenreichii]SBN51815.1 Pyridoxal kinase [Propionibacterium freudenreichii]
MTRILSVQSEVSYGFVGNSAVVFALRRIGVDVWPVNTVQFSNHTGYPSWRGPRLTPIDEAEIVRGLDELGILGQLDGVLTGYLSGPSMGRQIMAAVQLVKRRRPTALYCCDPVLGDDETGFYAAPGTLELFREQALPLAQVITPNRFELAALTNLPTSSLEEILIAADTLLDAGPSTVVVTSVPSLRPSQGAGHDDRIAMVAVQRDGAWQVSTPRLPGEFSGAGDLTSALFFAHSLAGESPGQALSHTASSIHGVLGATVAAGSRELELVAAQRELVHPSAVFEAARVR